MLKRNFFDKIPHKIHKFGSLTWKSLIAKVKSRKDQFKDGILMCCIISLIVTSLSYLGHFRLSEDRLADFFQRFIGKKAQDIVLLFITEKEYIQGFGGVSPLSRKRLAEVVEVLVKLKPRVMALDIEISDPTAEDHYLVEAFDRAISAGIPVVVAGKPMAVNAADRRGPDAIGDFEPYRDQRPHQTEEGYLLFRDIDPGKQWRDRVTTGGVVFRLERDGVFRKAEAFYLITSGEKPSPISSLPVAVVSSYIGMDEKSLFNTLSGIGEGHIVMRGQKNGAADVRIPLEKGGRVTPIFIGNYRNFDYVVNLKEMLEEYGTGKTGGRTVFYDRIVLIGGTYDVKDFYLTPVGRMSGMEILANVTQSILAGNLITRTSHIKAFILELALGCIVALAFVLTSPMRATIICLLIVLPSLFAASLISFSTAYHWLEFFPTVSAVFIHGFFTRLEKNFHDGTIRIVKFFHNVMIRIGKVFNIGK